MSLAQNFDIIRRVRCHPIAYIIKRLIVHSFTIFLSFIKPKKTRILSLTLFSLPWRLELRKGASHDILQLN